MPKLKKFPPIHDTLTGYDFTVDAPLTRSRAIRLKCLECQCGNAAEVRRCHISDCALWPWRLGRVARVYPPKKAGLEPSGPAGTNSEPSGSNVPENAAFRARADAQVDAT